MDPRIALISLFAMILTLSPQYSSADDVPAECATKLIDCQPYLKNPKNPPTSCCTPLKDLLANDRDCLCSLFKNEDFLKLINVTIEEALRLPKACGAKADVSLCDKGGNAPAPAVAPASQPTVPSTDGTSPAPAGNSTKNSATSYYGKIGSGGAAVGLMAFLMALFV